MKVNGWYFEEKQPDTIVGGCIAVYENMWPDPHETVNKLVELSKSSESNIYWSKAPTISDGVYQDMRTNKFLPLTMLADTTKEPALYDISNKFYNALMVACSSYRIIFSIGEDLYPEHFSILKYDKDTEYKCHYDGGPSSFRHVSAICYLNNDYIGGELEFVNFKVRIKPQPGMLILFPSNYAYSHIAHPVIKGTKYALVTWFRDREL